MSAGTSRPAATVNDTAPGVFGPDQQRKLGDLAMARSSLVESRDEEGSNKSASKASTAKSSPAKAGAALVKPPWKQVLSMLGSGHFIRMLESFQPEVVMPAEHTFISSNYIDRASELDHAVARACTACTPLWAWVKRQHAASSQLLADPTEMLDLATLEETEQRLMREQSALAAPLDEAEDKVSEATRSIIGAKRAVQRHKERCF